MQTVFACLITCAISTHVALLFVAWKHIPYLFLFSQNNWPSTISISPKLWERQLLQCQQERMVENATTSSVLTREDGGKRARTSWKTQRIWLHGNSQKRSTIWHDTIRRSTLRDDRQWTQEVDCALHCQEERCGWKKVWMKTLTGWWGWGHAIK